MPGRFVSSKLRFLQYKRDLKSRRKAGALTSSGGSPHGPSDVRPPKRQRSFFHLLREFWGLLRGFQWRMVFALATLTFSTILALGPPYATKVVVDYILGGKPFPPQAREYFHIPESPYHQLA